MKTWLFHVSAYATGIVVGEALWGIGKALLQ